MRTYAPSDMRAGGQPSEVLLLCESGPRGDWCSALMSIGTATLPNPWGAHPRREAAAGLDVTDSNLFPAGGGAENTWALQVRIRGCWRFCCILPWCSVESNSEMRRWGKAKACKGPFTVVLTAQAVWIHVFLSVTCFLMSEHMAAIGFDYTGWNSTFFESPEWLWG